MREVLQLSGFEMRGFALRGIEARGRFAEPFVVLRIEGELNIAARAVDRAQNDEAVLMVPRIRMRVNPRDQPRDRTFVKPKETLELPVFIHGRDFKDRHDTHLLS